MERILNVMGNFRVAVLGETSFDCNGRRIAPRLKKIKGDDLNKGT